MSFQPSVETIALACGVGGAYVDITADVREDEPVTEKMGRESEFDDVGPGQLTAVVDNGTGKYTPGNASSSLATPLVEGMGITWVQDGLLVAGKVRSAVPFFIDDYASPGSSRVKIIADDQLGTAGRHRFAGSLMASIIQAAEPYFQWRMDEAAGSTQAEEASDALPLVPDRQVSATFGVAGIPGVSDSQVELSDPSGGTVTMQTLPPVGPTPPIGPLAAPTYDANSMGWWSVWVTAAIPTGSLAFPIYTIFSDGSGSSQYAYCLVRLNSDGSVSLGTKPHTTGVVTYVSSAAGVFTMGAPTYVEVGYTTTFAAGVWTVTATLYINGVAIVSNNFTTIGQKLSTRVDAGTGTTMRVALLAHTRYRAAAVNVIGSTEASRLGALASVSPEIVLDALPAALSTSPIGAPDVQGQTALDALNDVVRTEQGHIYTATTGTVLAPVQKVKIRDRDRPQTITAARTFDITEINGSPAFVRDISTMVSQATAVGTLISQTEFDPSLVPFVGSASTSGRTLLLQGADLRAWAQDRIIRGKNISLRIAEFTIDALGTATNRWADLTALVPGDRIRFTGLPVAQLGFSTLEAFVLGRRRSSTKVRKQFTFYVSPVTPPTARYNTALNKYSAGGVLSLSAGISAGATALSVKTAVAITRFTTDPTKFPQDIQVGGPGGEQMTVTAVSGATPQIFTVVRGVNGTTAAAWPADADVEIVKPVQYAF
jgi:hypothetical protein